MPNVVNVCAFFWERISDFSQISEGGYDFVYVKKHCPPHSKFLPLPLMSACRWLFVTEGTVYYIWNTLEPPYKSSWHQTQSCCWLALGLFADLFFTPRLACQDSVSHVWSWGHYLPAGLQGMLQTLGSWQAPSGRGQSDRRWDQWWQLGRQIPAVRAHWEACLPSPYGTWIILSVPGSLGGQPLRSPPPTFHPKGAKR